MSLGLWHFLYYYFVKVKSESESEKFLLIRWPTSDKRDRFVYADVGGFTKSNKAQTLWLVIYLNIAGGSVAIILSWDLIKFIDKRD